MVIKKLSDANDKNKYVSVIFVGEWIYCYVWVIFYSILLWITRYKSKICTQFRIIKLYVEATLKNVMFQDKSKNVETI